MNTLSLNSGVFLASESTFQRHSLVSDPTTHSSDETVRGIGTLGGKAILAVGEATLRGFESLIIKRKLRAINNTFPHKDRDIIKGIEKLYDDALELSRPPLYREPVRQQVLKLLLTQIATRQTRHLLKSLFKWPCIELAIFLRSIMACMPPDWLPPKMIREKTQRELMLAYLTSQAAASNQEYHHASPLLDFLMTIATANDSSCQAVLDAGFLNMLLCMYTCNFGFSMTPHLSANGDQCKLMLEACGDALLRLCEFPGAVTVISLHPICSLWPKNIPLPIRPQGREEDRAAAWRSLGEVREDMVSRRLASLPSALRCLPDDDFPTPQLVDLYKDLLEFSRHEVYGLRIANDASRWVRKSAELGGAHWMALNDALDELPPVDSTAFRSRLLWSRHYPTSSPLKSALFLTSMPAADSDVRTYRRKSSQHSLSRSRATSQTHFEGIHPLWAVSADHQRRQDGLRSETHDHHTPDPSLLDPEDIVDNNLDILDNDSNIVGDEPYIVGGDSNIVDDEPYIVGGDPNVVYDGPYPYIVGDDPCPYIVLEDDPYIVEDDVNIVEDDPNIVEDDHKIVGGDPYPYIVEDDPIIVDDDSDTIEDSPEIDFDITNDKEFIGRRALRVDDLDIGSWKRGFAVGEKVTVIDNVIEGSPVYDFEITNDETAVGRAALGVLGSWKRRFAVGAKGTVLDIVNDNPEDDFDIGRVLRSRLWEHTLAVGAKGINNDKNVIRIEIERTWAVDKGGLDLIDSGSGGQLK